MEIPLDGGVDRAFEAVRKALSGQPDKGVGARGTAPLPMLAVTSGKDGCVRACVRACVAVAV